MDVGEVAARFGWATSTNACMTGSDLLHAASDAARIAAEQHALLWAADAVGERIVGVALAIHEGTCRAVDQSARVDGEAVLLVSGAVAGPVGLSQAAATARSLGAARVHAAVLGGWTEPVVELEQIHDLEHDVAAGSVDWSITHSAA